MSAHLDLVKIDNLEVRDVAALVLPDEALSENLLGLVIPFAVAAVRI